MARRGGMIRALGVGMIVVGLGPVLLSMTADAVAGLAGCDIAEKTAEDQLVTCVIFGLDVGEPLYTLSGLKWFAGLFLPLAVLGTLLLALIAIANRRR